ncbi:hypothetical protein Pfo_011128 [Paulownia fortunei]|nr:hypothetical protein Pfo_011128 [Paulownia fortunei]
MFYGVIPAKKDRYVKTKKSASRVQLPLTVNIHALLSFHFGVSFKLSQLLSSPGSMQKQPLGIGKDPMEIVPSKSTLRRNQCFHLAGPVSLYFLDFFPLSIIYV